MKKKKNLAKLNSFMQEVNKASKFISDINAFDQALDGNLTPAKLKAKNKFKNKLFKKLF